MAITIKNINSIKEKIKLLQGKDVKIRLNKGRNKIQFFEGKIDELYSSVFIISVAKGYALRTKVAICRSCFLIQFLVGLVACKLTNFILEHRKLLEEVVYRLFAILVHWRLAVERHELLDALLACTQCKVTEEYEVEHQRSCQY